MGLKVEPGARRGCSSCSQNGGLGFRGFRGLGFRGSICTSYSLSFLKWVIKGDSGILDYSSHWAAYCKKKHSVGSLIIYHEFREIIM